MNNYSKLSHEEPTNNDLPDDASNFTKKYCCEICRKIIQQTDIIIKNIKATSNPSSSSKKSAKSKNESDGNVEKHNHNIDNSSISNSTTSMKCNDSTSESSTNSSRKRIKKEKLERLADTVNKLNADNLHGCMHWGLLGGMYPPTSMECNSIFKPPMNSSTNRTKKDNLEHLENIANNLNVVNPLWCMQWGLMRGIYPPISMNCNSPFKPSMNSSTNRTKKEQLEHLENIANNLNVVIPPWCMRRGFLGGIYPPIFEPLMNSSRKRTKKDKLERLLLVFLFIFLFVAYFYVILFVI